MDFMSGTEMDFGGACTKLAPVPTMKLEPHSRLKPNIANKLILLSFFS